MNEGVIVKIIINFNLLVRLEPRSSLKASRESRGFGI
jgi:hypothetical protein